MIYNVVMLEFIRLVTNKMIDKNVFVVFLLEIVCNCQSIKFNSRKKFIISCRNELNDSNV